ncbi:MAG: hypothetical protein U0R69_03395 [Gaiellales bacterium]
MSAEESATFTKQLPVRQQLVDEEAPFLMRPLGDDPDDPRNWVLKAIDRTGQAAEEALHTWAFGFALEQQLLWNAMVEEKGEEAAGEVCAATWARLPQELRETAGFVLTRASDAPPYGLALELGTPELLERTGRTVDEELVFWNRAFTAHDHEMWQVLEYRYGAREGLIVYSRVWEQIALTFLDGVKQAIGLDSIETTEDIARMNRAYWEAIGCEVEDLETTPDRHVAIIKTCPFWDNMVDIYGKTAASRMHQKTIGATSANYYQAIMKAIGLWDEFYATQDEYRCLGDGQCRMVFERRSAMGEGGTGGS